MPHPAVEPLSLTNRLGQPVVLGVKFMPGEHRDTLFVSAPRQQASSFFGKNAEPFLMQLMEQLPLVPDRLSIIELRGDPEHPEFWRWRAEWVGRSPMALRAEPVASNGSRSALQSLLEGRRHEGSGQARAPRRRQA
ncbi:MULTISPECIES: hypothetical protein [Marinimicrobium]|jgi:hypothetical protein|uniref:Uncharacterized protein n=1 Tax=Marinimicrobium koreense TaxID=306545 RepID=A0A3N1NTV6_9GAMM|nr:MULTISPECIES: hypothetical protein [Marinimicrobium]ROQ19603.1 hypothetical protein EDC38_0187 [Marinimicrobium koreense]|tara:strand:- start:31 stop:438 length:408 start_codon:yes stop_codon:yes gene_type:complete